MQTIQLKQRGVITLPKKLREALGLFEGQSLSVRQENSSIVIEPQHSVDARVVAAVKESLDDLKHGRYITFSSVEEFHEKRKKYVYKAH